jgi:hypothetical protein
MQDSYNLLYEFIEVGWMQQATQKEKFPAMARITPLTLYPIYWRREFYKTTNKVWAPAIYAFA